MKEFANNYEKGKRVGLNTHLCEILERLSDIPRDEPYMSHQMITDSTQQAAFDEKP